MKNPSLSQPHPKHIKARARQFDEVYVRDSKGFPTEGNEIRQRRRLRVDRDRCRQAAPSETVLLRQKIVLDLVSRG
mgnify:CR=1 FL=1